MLEICPSLLWNRDGLKIEGDLLVELRLGYGRFPNTSCIEITGCLVQGVHLIHTFLL